jgi:hypothetical protein
VTVAVSDVEEFRPEVMTVADDEVVVYRGAQRSVLADLDPDTDIDLGFRTVHTLPRRGELLATFTTVNDVHFGETVCGRVGGADFATFSVEPGATPYPVVMNAGAVAEMSAVGPDAVVVKGDLTSTGVVEEYQQFRDMYDSAFGDRLLHVRGNHDAYAGETFAADAPVAHVLPGVVLAVLDTVIPTDTPGRVTTSAADAKAIATEIGRPVMVKAQVKAGGRGKAGRTSGLPACYQWARIHHYDGQAGLATRFHHPLAASVRH